MKRSLMKALLFLALLLVSGCSILGSSRDIPEVKPVETQETSVQNLTSHVINKTAKGNNGVAVMTSAGSQQGDESHNRHNRGSHGAKSQGYTHKIK